MIRLMRPTLSGAAVAAAGAALRSGWPGPGPLVEEFESAFAELVQADHVVAVSSCTAALHLALRLLDLPPGSEVVTTPITFVATNQVLLYERLVPVFADVEPDTGNIDPRSVEERITDRTRAIMAVHLTGRPCDLDALHRIARRHDLTVIEDCAHACGSMHAGRPIGSHSGLQAFSFQATKNLTTVDGGALCVRDGEMAARARRLRWMGIDRTTHERRRGSSYSWRYEVGELGFKYSMNDLNAAIGLAELPGLARANLRRREMADRYRQALTGRPGVECLRPGRAADLSATYLFPVLVDDRDRVMAELAEHGIETGVHFERNDRHAMFARADLPEAERYWRRALSLPLHLGLSDGEIEFVVDRLLAAAAAARARAVAHR